MSDAPPQPETISRLFDAVYPSFALLAGMELELFTALEGGPRSAEQLAGALDVAAIKLSPLLYALAVAGLLTIEHDLFANTSEADTYLVRGKPAYLGGIRDLISSNWANILKTAATIRAGGPIHQYDYHDMPPEELVALFRGLNLGARQDAERLMSQHDFSSCQTLLDVGGGSGALAIVIAKAHPQLRATVVDLPLVTPITQQFIEEANAADQVDTLTADLTREALSGSYDAIVLRHVIQVLSADDSRALLSNLAAALNPGGTIYLIGWILDNSRVTPQKTVGFNLVLLNGYQDGQAYTEDEYFTWLGEAGFEASERVVYPDGSSIVTARKPM